MRSLAYKIFDSPIRSHSKYQLSFSCLWIKAYTKLLKFIQHGLSSEGKIPIALEKLRNDCTNKWQILIGQAKLIRIIWKRYGFRSYRFEREAFFWHSHQHWRQIISNFLSKVDWVATKTQEFSSSILAQSDYFLNFLLAYPKEGCLRELVEEFII